MKCPNCTATMQLDHDYGDWACPTCGLAGPADVLEGLAARLAPAGVLAEAERLLRPAGNPNRFTNVWWHLDVGVETAEGPDGDFDSLADAYEKLLKETP